MTPKNEAAERLRERFSRTIYSVDADLDAALATERRNTVELIRERLVVEYRLDNNRDAVLTAILAEVSR